MSAGCDLSVPDVRCRSVTGPRLSGHSVDRTKGTSTDPRGALAGGAQGDPGVERPAQQEPQPKPPMISVVLAEDHETVREGLRLLVDEQADMEVVAAVGDGAGALEQARRLRP